MNQLIDLNEIELAEINGGTWPVFWRDCIRAGWALGKWLAEND